MIILDNLSSHKSPRPPMPCARSAQNGFSSCLPKPDLNPIKAFAKLKAGSRRAARTDPTSESLARRCTYGDRLTEEEY